MSFKVGDKVVCVDAPADSYRLLKVGDVGVVQGVDAKARNLTINGRDWWCDNRFRLAEPIASVNGLTREQIEDQIIEISDKYHAEHKRLVDLLDKLPQKRFVYFNCYERRPEGPFNTREDADVVAKNNADFYTRTACIKVEWEDGRYDD